MNSQKPNFLRSTERGPLREQGPRIEPLAPSKKDQEVAPLENQPLSGAVVSLPASAPVAASAPATVESRLRQILSEDMTELLVQLPADKKREVQAEGLKTIEQIQVLLRQTHLQIRKIFQLIWQWLKRIPGLNRFFLEQEAKKKTEEILELEEENK